MGNVSVEAGGVEAWEGNWDLAAGAAADCVADASERQMNTKTTNNNDNNNNNSITTLVSLINTPLQHVSQSAI